MLMSEPKSKREVLNGITTTIPSSSIQRPNADWKLFRRALLRLSDDEILVLSIPGKTGREVSNHVRGHLHNISTSGFRVRVINLGDGNVGVFREASRTLSKLQLEFTVLQIRECAQLVKAFFPLRLHKLVSAVRRIVPGECLMVKEHLGAVHKCNLSQSLRERLSRYDFGFKVSCREWLDGSAVVHRRNDAIPTMSADIMKSIDMTDDGIRVVQFKDIWSRCTEQHGILLRLAVQLNELKIGEAITVPIAKLGERATRGGVATSLKTTGLLTVKIKVLLLDGDELAFLRTGTRNAT